MWHNEAKAQAECVACRSRGSSLVLSSGARGLSRKGVAGVNSKTYGIGLAENTSAVIHNAFITEKARHVSLETARLRCHFATVRRRTDRKAEHFRVCRCIAVLSFRLIRSGMAGANHLPPSTLDFSHFALPEPTRLVHSHGS